MNVLLTYDSGFPTRLEKHANLARMLQELGEPIAIGPNGADYMLEWRPIFPGVPIPTYMLSDPWKLDPQRRAIVRVSLTN